MSAEKIHYSIILPTYNESENIRPIIEELESFFSVKKKPFEIVVVDDSSTDGTDNVIRDLQKRYDNIVLLDKNPKEGIGKALKRGYDTAHGEWLLSMDTDRAFHISEIDRLIEQTHHGYDFVVGSKYLKGAHYIKDDFTAQWRSKLSEYGNAYIALVTRLSLKDFSMNFRLLRKDVWGKIQTTDNENFFLVEMLVDAHRKGYKIKEVGVTLLPRGYGVSKTKVWKQIFKFFGKATKLGMKKSA